jgi:DNA-binding NarL/FixJ family response regulator
MPPTSTDEGIRLARWMRTAHPNIGVIVLSNYADPRYAAGLLDGGTLGRGCLLKGHAGLRLIRSGKRYSEVGLKFQLAMEGKSRWD